MNHAGDEYKYLCKQRDKTFDTMTDSIEMRGNILNGICDGAALDDPMTNKMCLLLAHGGGEAKYAPHLPMWLLLLGLGGRNNSRRQAGVGGPVFNVLGRLH